MRKGLLSFFVIIIFTLVAKSECPPFYEHASVPVQIDNCIIIVEFCYQCLDGVGIDYYITNYSCDISCSNLLIENFNTQIKNAIHEFLIIQVPNCFIYACDDPSAGTRKITRHYRDCWQKMFIPPNILLYEACCSFAGGECVSIYEVCVWYNVNGQIEIKEILENSYYVGDPNCPIGNPPLPDPLPEEPWFSNCYRYSCD